MIRYVFVTVTAIVILGLTMLVLVLPTQPLDKPDINGESKISNSFLIVDILLFDGRQFLEHQSIRIEQGKIVAIEPILTAKSDETVIDGKGLTALPGLQDAHTHSYGMALKDALRFGVTTHFDMFSIENDLDLTRAARDRLNRTNKADLFSSGIMATVERGHGTQYGFAIDTIGSIEEVEAWVTQRKQAGVDYIKLVYMPYQDRTPSLDRKTAAAIIHQAHAQGLQAFAHISNQAAAKDMLEEGIDGLVHIFADSFASEEVIQLAKKNSIFIIPTLAVIASVHKSAQNIELAQRPLVADFLSSQQKSSIDSTFGVEISGFDLAIAKQNVKRFFDAGVPILVGSDAPNPGTAYGISTHHEMFLLVESGLTPTQALIAATSLPTQYISAAKSAMTKEHNPEQIEVDVRGRLQVGSRADMMLIKGDPRGNIYNTLNIQQVFKNGFAIERNAISISDDEKVSQTITTPLLGDFEDPQKSTQIDNFLWSPSDDQIAKGQSVAKIERVSPGAERTNSALYISAKVNAGFPFPWAGAAIGDFTAPITGWDVSDYSQLVFDVKGTPGTYRVLSFSTESAGIPPSQNFVIDEQWQQVSLPLDKFSGFNPLQFSGFAIVAGPTLGNFQFTLDNVRLE